MWETWVWKELFAKVIHTLSKVRWKLISINVAGLDDNLFSDTLFGHSKGAFSSANRDRDGLLKKAENGTIFLDEIWDLSHLSQVKLLRVIEQKEYSPLWSDNIKKTNSQFIASTNVDLKNAIKNNSFREDLFYRLAFNHILIPPLRERKDDIPILTLHFLKKAFIEYEIKNNLNINFEKLFFILKNYSFPWNIRELEVMIYNFVGWYNWSRTLSLNPIQKWINWNSNTSTKESSNCFWYHDFSKETDLAWLKKAYEKAVNNLILQSLKNNNWNRTMAAIELGISRQAFFKRLQKLKNEQDKINQDSHVITN